MKSALEILDQCPEDDIFLIPVKLNDCTPSHIKISDLHWIDIFPEEKYEEGLKKILEFVSPGSFLLRNQSCELSHEEVNDMIRRHAFFDRWRNPGSRGVSHKYEEQEILGDKVIFDNATALMWQQAGSSEAYKYEEAKNYVKELNEKDCAGFDDWRLPTLEEAMNLMEREMMNGDLHNNPLFDKRQVHIWTSDQVKEEPRAWYVTFLYGSCDDLFHYSYGYIRAVRSGKSSA